jgi:hypothetical protein
MATIRLPPDFREFLALLNSRGVEYLVVGGYAVALHGYVRPTGGLDVWVAVKPENAARIVEVLREFGFPPRALSQGPFLAKGRITRMGVPPLRIEILTELSGVSFDACYRRRRLERSGGVVIPLIGLADLRRNKRAAGRYKDLDDLEQLSARRVRGRKTASKRPRP